MSPNAFLMGTIGAQSFAQLVDDVQDKVVQRRGWCSHVRAILNDGGGNGPNVALSLRLPVAFELECAGLLKS